MWDETTYPFPNFNRPQASMCWYHKSWYMFPIFDLMVLYCLPLYKMYIYGFQSPNIHLHSSIALNIWIKHRILFSSLPMYFILVHTYHTITTSACRNMCQRFFSFVNYISSHLRQAINILQWNHTLLLYSMRQILYVGETCIMFPTSNCCSNLGKKIRCDH